LYYDFTLYATTAALVFNQVFFPAGDPLVGTLAAFATFFVGYLARPLGGLIFGHFGDRLGRKNVLIITMVMMGAGHVSRSACCPPTTRSASPRRCCSS
jgi:MHS family shikimate/dehydroshikimate transporter-like MFS transporter